jgi:hypothetical protein
MFGGTTIPPRPARSMILLLISLPSFLMAAARGTEAPIGTAGEVKLASGRTVGYTVHFDRNSLRIEDAFPWSQGRLLLATDAGLRLYNPTVGRLSRIDLPEPPQPATTLTTDGRGRLWLGCRTGGLWMIDPAANAVESVDRVPLIGKGTVYSLAPDPNREDGVIVALGSRGVAFVRAGQKP